MLEMSLSGLMSGDQKRDNGLVLAPRARPRLYTVLEATISKSFNRCRKDRSGTKH